MFVRTTVINKIKNLTKFVKGIQGGTSAGKTFGVLPILIDIATKNPLTETSIVAESIPHLKRGAMKDFKKIMLQTGRWFDNRWNATDFKYTFANGSQIEFFSADNDSKLRGARRDYLYMNEANNMQFHAYTELASRTKLGVYLDWNPTNEFWFHTELQNDDDVDFIIVNYLDNEACPESALNFINKAKEKSKTSTYWENWYNVYGLGQLGKLEGVVFNNWEQIDILPTEAKFIGCGLDFGYSNDPTALIGVYEYNDKIIVDEMIYNTSLLNSDIVKLMKQDRRLPIWADSAEPKSIEEIRRAGFNIKAVVKGSDSINFGISVLQQKEILVTKSSVNLIKELRNYSWDVDKTGKKLNKPIDNYNHAIDALRYFAMMQFAIKQNRTVRIT
jgi:phage terminase large subunit